MNLFADTSLAARIERAECRMLVACATQIAQRNDGVLQIAIAGGLAVYTGQGSPTNKVAGLGFAGPVDEGEIEAVEAAFAHRGAPVQVELSTLADPVVGVMLSRRGYDVVGFENVLGRALDDIPDPDGSPAIVVRESGLQEVDTWIDVVVTGFMTPDTQGVASQDSFSREVIEAVMRDLCDAHGFVRYLAEKGGELVGGASLSLNADIALLTGASTLPDHRCMGVQGALLARRLCDARQQGCEVAIVTTQPGSKSQQNAQRRGFELLYSRAIMVREAE